MNDSVANYKKFIEVTSDFKKFKGFTKYIEGLISKGTINVEFRGNALGISNLKEENILELEESLSFKREEIADYTSMFTFSIALAFGPYQDISKYDLSKEEINKISKRIDFIKKFDSKNLTFQKKLLLSQNQIVPRFERLTAENYIRVSKITRADGEESFELTPQLLTKIITRTKEGILKDLVFSLTQRDLDEILRVLQHQKKTLINLYEKRDKIRGDLDGDNT